MVGVIFLLYSEEKFDQQVIAKLLQEKEKYGFVLVELPRLSNSQLRLFKADSAEASQLRQTVVEQTSKAISSMKKHWQHNYILYPVYFREQLDQTLNRTYYVPMKLEAPLIERFKASGTTDSLEEFVELESIVRAGHQLNINLIQGFNSQLINLVKTANLDPDQALKLFKGSGG